MRFGEIVKYSVYRTPFLQRIAFPTYKYKVSPGELAFICDGIDRTKPVGGCVLEIGVAKGDTSAFILEHMRSTGDDRPVYLIDTFSGFTGDSVDHETTARSKAHPQFDGFRYTDPHILRKALQRCGYANFNIIQNDAAKIDYTVLGPISVVLLDIDLYKPTKEALNRIWPLLTSPGFICIDDCYPDTQWDGALQAYEEFISENKLSKMIVGGEGGTITK